MLRAAVEHLYRSLPAAVLMNRPPITAHWCSYAGPFLSLAPCFVRKSLVDGVAKRICPPIPFRRLHLFCTTGLSLRGESDNHVCQTFEEEEGFQPPQPNRNRMRLALMSASTEMWVAVGPVTRTPIPIRCYASFTKEEPCLNVADWLRRCGIRTVAMESTGVYWMFHVPEPGVSRVRESAWSTPTPPSTLPAARPMWTIANGYSICIRWDC